MATTYSAGSWSGQSALEIGFADAVLATVFGVVVWGAVFGYTGGLADAVMMRIVDIGLAILAIFLLIYLSSVFRPTIAGDPGFVAAVLARARAAGAR